MTDTDNKKLFRARYAVDGARLIEDPVLELSNGRFTRVESYHDAGDRFNSGAIESLGEVVVVPGFVNAHSHSFQRLIRGRTEYIRADKLDDDFWSWRTEMYDAALQLAPDKLERVARLAYREMAKVGITAVGEFHYLHHRPDGTTYGDPNELAHRVIRAAKDAGLRIVLLRAAYNRAGYRTERNPKQRRFYEPDLETYLERTRDLRETWRQDQSVSVGFAPHSIRAVPRDWLEGIAEVAADTDMPVHIHASEQRREIEQSRFEYGAPPIEVFEQVGLLDTDLTIIHGTHLTDHEIDLLDEYGVTVCACPTTERNLGDGFLPASKLVEADVSIALGTDSHANIDMGEEMRVVEYHERLRRERRNVLATEAWMREHPDAETGTMSTGQLLLDMGTKNGASALGLSGGTLRPDAPADFATFDLNHVSMLGTTPESVANQVVLSATPGAVDQVYVSGKPIPDAES